VGNRCGGTVTLETGSERGVIVANTVHTLVDNGTSTEIAYNDI
jgi:hypothetical protein